jgi:hypothetical protein
VRTLRRGCDAKREVSSIRKKGATPLLAEFGRRPRIGVRKSVPAGGNRVAFGVRWSPNTERPDTLVACEKQRP